MLYYSPVLWNEVLAHDADINLQKLQNNRLFFSVSLQVLTPEEGVSGLTLIRVLLCVL